MRHVITLLIALAIPLTAADLPRGAERALERYEKEASKAKEAYDEAMAEAITEVVDALAKEQDKATRDGDLDLALALRAKIEELTPEPEDGADVAATESAGPATRDVVINAASAGASLGELAAGETLVMAYVSGEWTAYPSWPVESPDRATKSQHRMMLVIPGGDEIVIPHDTARKPFQHRATAPGEYRLRIADPVLGGNAGTVTYKVGIR